MKTTASEKQIEANRRNAQKCTGPKTPEGRAASKMNALKHGIFLKDMIVKATAAVENPREFTELHRRFWEHLMPVGPLEEMLVNQIVTTHWRLRRTLKAESGEIALGVNRVQRNRAPNPALDFAFWMSHRDPIDAMSDSSHENALLQRRLWDMQAAVEKDGELTEAAIRLVSLGRSNKLTERLTELREWFVKNPEQLDEPALRAKHQQQVVDFIQRQREYLESLHPACEDREEKETGALLSAAMLPKKEVLEKIMRYETKLHRHLTRAMTRLERLQRLRQGEVVPPPLSVDVSLKE